MPLTRDALIKYFQDELDLDTTSIDDETPLFSSNLLDSFTMVDVINYVETECGIKINAAEVTMDNLDSVQRILVFAEARTK
jgi:acyl carrier protein